MDIENVSNKLVRLREFAVEANTAINSAIASSVETIEALMKEIESLNKIISEQAIKETESKAKAAEWKSAEAKYLSLLAGQKGINQDLQNRVNIQQEEIEILRSISKSKSNNARGLKF